MIMNVMLQKKEIGSVKKMLSKAYDQFEEYLKNPDPEMTAKLLEILKDQKQFVDSFLDDVEMINISMEKKIDDMDDMMEEKKISKSKWGILD